MKAVKIILALSLALVLSFVLVGCKEVIPQDEIDRIIENVVNAQFDSVKMDLDMTVTVEIIGGPDAGEMLMWVDGVGVMDMVNQEMQMTMDVIMDIPGIGHNYLIEIENVEYLDAMRVKVEVVQDIFHGNIGELENLKRRIVEELKNEILIRPQVILVEPNSLPKSEGKAVRVVDHRE